MNIAEWKSSVENGKIPTRLLAEIKPTQFDPDLGGPALMHPEAAAAMSAMLAAARADGRSFLVKYSYRTFSKQEEKWEDFQNGGNLAAFPGTSNHGWGLSVDLTALDELDLGWLRRNAARFGYTNDVPTEVWHWTYNGTWTGKWEEEDDVKFEMWDEGWTKYMERFASKGGDPGEAPQDREKWFKKGWGAARKAMNNPKAN